MGDIKAQSPIAATANSLINIPLLILLYIQHHLYFRARGYDFVVCRLSLNVVLSIDPRWGGYRVYVLAGARREWLFCICDFKQNLFESNFIMTIISH